MNATGCLGPTVRGQCALLGMCQCHSVHQYYLLSLLILPLRTPHSSCNVYTGMNITSHIQHEYRLLSNIHWSHMMLIPSETLQPKIPCFHSSTVTSNRNHLDFLCIFLKVRLPQNSAWRIWYLLELWDLHSNLKPIPLFWIKVAQQSSTQCSTINMGPLWNFRCLKGWTWERNYFSRDEGLYLLAIYNTGLHNEM